MFLVDFALRCSPLPNPRGQLTGPKMPRALHLGVAAMSLFLVIVYVVAQSPEDGCSIQTVFAGLSAIKQDPDCRSGCPGSCPDDWTPAADDTCNAACGRVFEPFWVRHPAPPLQRCCCLRNAALPLLPLLPPLPLPAHVLCTSSRSLIVA